MGGSTVVAADQIPRLVAFDVETTGLEPTEDRIVEFAFIVLDEELNELDRWSQLVDPGQPIPRAATEIHGIDDEDVRGCPTFPSLGPLVQATIQDRLLMAYHHAFDRDFLHAELVRAGGPGIPDDHPFVDPLVHFKRHVPDTSNTLSAAVEHYLSSPLDGAHRAIEDTQAMVDVFRAMQRVHPDLSGPLSDAVVEVRDWADGDRKLYRDDRGELRFGFGKHEGQPVHRHTDYAEWMLEADFDDDTKTRLEEALKP